MGPGRPSPSCSSITVGTTRTTPPSKGTSTSSKYSEAMASPTQHIYYSTGSGPLGRVDPYLFWLRYMVDSDEGDIPQTIGVSYANNESSVPQGYARSVCTLIARLGLRGVGVLFASSDFGVG
ncbi:hypothetical protein EDB85DRAFT_1919100 [Lactarius pseudohatsudake]|nr:hypothetical protein EDB85DRAFT_1919100 [Lactarius pseudohatsudake]